ncbi:hypothetical protein [Pannonibacter carbonis]|uniref:hypothetical protein n=1 Tax=Pannonibacter carbonis TaxID=2067569 RepID=UPI0013007271|nr:hypothetical protein [Pannonibacter carbonis]
MAGNRAPSPAGKHDPPAPWPDFARGWRAFDKGLPLDLLQFSNASDENMSVLWGGDFAQKLGNVRVQSLGVAGNSVNQKKLTLSAGVTLGYRVKFSSFLHRSMTRPRYALLIFAIALVSGFIDPLSNRES